MIGAIDEKAGLFVDRAGSIPAALLERLGRSETLSPLHQCAQVIELALRVQREGEELLVDRIEASAHLGQTASGKVIRRRIDGEAHALPRIAQIDLIEGRLLGPRHPFRIEGRGSLCRQIFEDA